MVILNDLVAELGPVILDPDPVGHGGQITDLCLHAPSAPIGPGDLVLAVAVSSSTELRRLVSEAIDVGASGVVSAIAPDRSVVDLVRRRRLTVATKAVSTSWTDLFRSVQIALSAADLSDPDEPRVLQQLADRIAVGWQAPVTIEDLEGRLITHSSNQDGADEARRTTIVERGTAPEAVVSHRDRGLYEALVTADQVWVPRDGVTRSRTVVALRSDEELVGTVWVLCDQPLAPEQIQAAAAVLSSAAGHLTDQRPISGGATVTARALRSILHQAPTSLRLELGPPPWVVAVISCPVRSQEVQLTLWYERLRRRGWSDPLLTAIDDAVVCVLTEAGTGPGSLPWWQDQVQIVSADPMMRVAIGPRAMNTAELQQSHHGATELTRICQLWPDLSAEVLDPRTHWAQLIIHRLLAHRPSEDHWQIGPIPELLALPEILRRTLVCHLEHGSNIPRTAAALSIHPNTLRYRLGRIAASGVDLDDPLVQVALHLHLVARRADGQPIDS